MSVAGPRARLTDPLTSHEAGDATESVVAASQAVVLSILHAVGAPMTHADIIAEDHDPFTQWRMFSESRLRTACAELVELGRVQPVGKFKPAGSRAHHTLWALT